MNSGGGVERTWEVFPPESSPESTQGQFKAPQPDQEQGVVACLRGKLPSWMPGSTKSNEPKWQNAGTFVPPGQTSSLYEAPTPSTVSAAPPHIEAGKSKPFTSLLSFLSKIASRSERSETAAAQVPAAAAPKTESFSFAKLLYSIVPSRLMSHLPSSTKSTILQTLTQKDVFSARDREFLGKELASLNNDIATTFLSAIDADMGAKIQSIGWTLQEGTSDDLQNVAVTLHVLKTLTENTRKEIPKDQMQDFGRILDPKIAEIVNSQKLLVNPQEVRDYLNNLLIAFQAARADFKEASEALKSGQQKPGEKAPEKPYSAQPKENGAIKVTLPLAYFGRFESNEIDQKARDMAIDVMKSSNETKVYYIVGRESGGTRTTGVKLLIKDENGDIKEKTLSFHPDHPEDAAEMEELLQNGAEIQIPGRAQAFNRTQLIANFRIGGMPATPAPEGSPPPPTSVAATTLESAVSTVSAATPIPEDGNNHTTFQITVGPNLQSLENVKPRFSPKKQKVVEKFMGDKSPLSACTMKKFSLNNEEAVLKLRPNQASNSSVTSERGFFNDPPAKEGHMQFLMNFADKDLFAGCSSEHAAQDEIQQLEMPGLAVVRKIAQEQRQRMLEGTQAVIVIGLTRFGTLNSQGIYGDAFKSAKDETIASKVTPKPPERRNVLAIAAPRGGIEGQRVTLENIKANFLTAYNGFLAAKQEAAANGEKCQIDTGFWGAGAFGNNPTVSIAVQLLAAKMAGVDTLRIFTGPNHPSKNFQDAEKWINDYFEKNPDATIADALNDLSTKGYMYKAKEEAVISG